MVVMMIPSRARSSEGGRGEDCWGKTSSRECQGWESQQTIMLLILYCSLMSMLSPLFPRRAGRSRLDQPLLLQGGFTCIVSAILITLLPYHHHHVVLAKESYQHGKVLSRFYFPQKRPQGSAGPCWKRCEDDVRHLIRNPTTTRRHQEFYEINNLKRLSQKENRIYFNDGSTCCRLQWFSCIWKKNIFREVLHVKLLVSTWWPLVTFCGH